MLQIQKRVTSILREALPTTITGSMVVLYAALPLKTEQSGSNSIVCRCSLDIKRELIKIDVDITSEDELHPEYYDALEASYLATFEWLVG